MATAKIVREYAGGFEITRDYPVVEEFATCDSHWAARNKAVTAQLVERPNDVLVRVTERWRDGSAEKRTCQTFDDLDEAREYAERLCQSPFGDTYHKVCRPSRWEELGPEKPSDLQPQRPDERHKKLFYIRTWPDGTKEYSVRKAHFAASSHLYLTAFGPGAACDQWGRTIERGLKPITYPVSTY